LKVLIDQQFHLGHHYQYLAHLLPVLGPIVDQVVVATTEEGQKSVEFKTLLAPLAGRSISFEPILPAASPWMPMNERWRVHRDLRDAVRKVRPDYVLIPSGDGQTTMMGLARLSGLGAVPGRIPCEVGIHFGTGASALRRQDRVRDFLNQLNLVAASLERVHLINLLFYEQVRARRPHDRRFVLMPHPVAANPRLSQTESRRRLQLPEAGKYIGLAASIDSRKAVSEFLAAFRAAARPNERLILAGGITETHLRKIEASFSDLLKDGRLIMLQGFLDPDVYQTVLSALDVVCTPYPRFAGLSATLLEGVAAGRPVLANAFGWSQAVIERFKLGWTCDVLDHAAFTRTVRQALDRAVEYQESEATKRLLAFHAPSNFAESWVQGIRERLGRSNAAVCPWEWVAESLPAARRAAL
jgi:glycosyltransferase involved in cell wall biosynthesis